MTAKDALRREMKARLREVAGEREEKSAAICQAVERHPAWASARRIAVFDAMLSEPSLAALRPAVRQQFFFPRVHGAELRLREGSSLGPAVFRGGYREPPAEGEEALEVDLILVPGLAFTTAGARLGRGGGYYDRLLARLPAETVRLGICFTLQVLPELPVEAHDQRLHGIITEAGLAAS